jgi:hypothetical protein
MECDYTHLNHNSLVSQKSGHQGCDYKKGFIVFKYGIRIKSISIYFSKLELGVLHKSKGLPNINTNQCWALLMF